MEQSVFRKEKPAGVNHASALYSQGVLKISVQLVSDQPQESLQKVFSEAWQIEHKRGSLHCSTEQVWIHKEDSRQNQQAEDEASSKFSGIEKSADTSYWSPIWRIRAATPSKVVVALVVVIITNKVHKGTCFGVRNT